MSIAVSWQGRRRVFMDVPCPQARVEETEDLVLTTPIHPPSPVPLPRAGFRSLRSSEPEHPNVYQPLHRGKPYRDAEHVRVAVHPRTRHEHHNSFDSGSRDTVTVHGTAITNLVVSITDNGTIWFFDVNTCQRARGGVGGHQHIAIAARSVGWFPGEYFCLSTSLMVAVRPSAEHSYTLSVSLHYAC